MRHGHVAVLVLAVGIVLAALALVPALSPVGTASAVQCADDETEVEITLVNDDFGSYSPNDIYYTIAKNGGAYDGIVENENEELESSPYLIRDVNRYPAEGQHRLTACYTEGLQHDVQLENQDGSETTFYDGIEDDLFYLVEGGVRDGTVEKEYINEDNVEVRFKTTLSCSPDERKVEMVFGGEARGTYTAFVDGDEIRVEDNDLDSGETETRERCFEYGDTYTVEQKGEHTDHGSIYDPEIEDVKYLDSNGDYVYLGSNDDISETNPNARVEFTVNRAPTADATVEGDTTSIVEGNTSIEFNGTDSSDPDGNSLSYSWDFGDGTTETGETVTHNYSDAVSTRGGSETFSPDLTVDDGLDRNNLDTDSDFATITVYNDMDGDGRADSDDAPGPADPDDDGDGIPDSVEEESTSTTDLPDDATTVTVDGTEYPDSDGDGNADLWDRDSDGDGIPDSVEGDNDTDGDGTADYRDVDSDNDGVPDAEEGTTDGDGDGVPAYRDASPRFTGGADLSTIDEDPTSNPGTTVSELLGDVFDDTDGGEDSLAGVALTANGAAADEGTWEYSTDSGTTWHAVESVSPEDGLLLDAATTLRFAPTRSYNGEPGNLTVFAVDDGDTTDFTDGDTRRTFDTTADDALSPVSPSGVPVGITVNAAPVADARTDGDPRPGEEFSFDGTGSTDVEGPIDTYEWDVDDDGEYELTGATPTHTYETEGDYAVTLKVTDSEGVTDTDTKIIRVESADPEFRRTNLSVSPEEITVNDSVEVSVDIENVGDASGTYGLAATVDGERDTVEVGESLSPGETVRDSLNLTLDDPGTFEVGIIGLRDDPQTQTVTVTEPSANLSVTDYDLNETNVFIDETVTIEATVANTGDAAGTVDVPLVVDGETVETEALDVEANATETVEFEWTADEAGEVELAVADLDPRTVTVTDAPAPNLSVTTYDLSETELAVNETLTVEATVRNDGTEAGTLDVPLLVDNETIETETVDVEANATETIEFEWGADEAGEVDVSVDTLEPTTVTVTGTDSSLAEYANDDGVVDTPGLREAISDWRRDAIDTALLRDVITAWRTGEVVA